MYTPLVRITNTNPVKKNYKYYEIILKDLNNLSKIINLHLNVIDTNKLVNVSIFNSTYQSVRKWIT